MLPAPDDLIHVLLELAVPHEDIPEILALAGSVDQDLIEPYARMLADHMGSLDSDPPRFEPRPDLHPFFFVLVFVAARPQVLAYHRAHGIPGTASRFILADLGRQLAVHRRRHGLSGMGAPHWFTYIFRGMIYQCGRLQFQRTRMPEVFPFPATDPALSVHIPEFCGPLTPAACDVAFARAAEFFARHFPDEPYEVAVCMSWLLDPELAAHLPAGSNIVLFQRRFTLVDTQDSDSFSRFVFPGRRLAERPWRVGRGYRRL